ncbi:hypothetical protein [Citrobacter freundii]|uniref:hypothetical protein n=1 Tax=Citrobacter freundii TaxID=546 RepID=UPI00358DBF63
MPSDPSDSPKPLAGSAETGWCVSSCLAEWGSTTGPPRGPGAEGGHCPARLSGSGHHGTAAKRTNQQEIDQNRQDEAHGKVLHEAQLQQTNSNSVN